MPPTNIGKPIFIIETGEHYENGFEPTIPGTLHQLRRCSVNFCWICRACKRACRITWVWASTYWDPAGVNIPNLSGGFINGDNLPDAIYIWNGLTLFDNADASGSTDVNAANYSMPLPAIDALGGKLQVAGESEARPRR